HGIREPDRPETDTAVRRRLLRLHHEVSSDTRQSLTDRLHSRHAARAAAARAERSEAGLLEVQGRDDETRRTGVRDLDRVEQLGCVEPLDGRGRARAARMAADLDPGAPEAQVDAAR